MEQDTNTGSGTDAPNRPKKIGPYTIRRTLVEDETGTLYHAEQNDPCRSVALRVIRSDLLSTTHDVRRFWSDIEALGRLQDPSIVPVLGVGCTPSGQYYYAAELASGEPLDTFMDRNPVTRRSGARDVRALLAMFRRLCTAVDHAHQRGVVHGNLRPANVLVTCSRGARGLEAAARSASFKMLDFGLGKTMAQPTVRAARSDAHTDGLAYAAPEYISGDPPDVRSDVYSLGLLLYRMLTGRQPFATDGFPLVVLKRILNEEPVQPSVVWRRMRRRMDHDLETIVLRAMSKKPDDRYANVWALSEDVQRYLDTEPIRARQATLLYRLQKALVRRRAAVAAAAWVLLVLLQSLLG